MKSLIVVIILIGWLPWTDGSAIALSKGRIRRHQSPCIGRGWFDGIGGDKVGICSTTTGEDLPMVVLHESQHYLAAHYGIYDKSWERGDEIAWLALACTWSEGEKVRVEARKFARLGGWELHAQLPWLMEGRLCPELAPWYPWFELERVKEKR